MEKQYRDASNLNARIALHERFSTNERPLPRWIFDQFELPSEARILEIGCGPGNLWMQNLDRIPDGWAVTLTDASPGMVREAEENLGGRSRFQFQVADARELPFEHEGFDAVATNHMLYHVPDRPKAFSEISRVLRRDGVLYAATNGIGSQREMVGMLRVLDPSHPYETLSEALLNFNLENGAEQLSPWFREVSLRRYEDALVVSEVEPLVDYLLSTTTAQAVADRVTKEEFRRRVSELTESLERELADHGAIRITKDPRLFVARR